MIKILVPETNYSSTAGVNKNKGTLPLHSLVRSLFISLNPILFAICTVHSANEQL
jgi:hypothetical protein